MLARDHLVKELEELDEKQLHEIQEYVKFLKFRSRLAPPPALDEEQLAKLYGEFAQEDRLLAEEGMTDYAKNLSKEDK